MLEKQNKYGNTRVIENGTLYSSKREASVGAELQLLQRVGKIRNLQLQIPFILQEASKPQGLRAIKYIADFVFEEKQGTAWKKVVADCKGFPTPVYKLKRKMFIYKYPDIEFREIK